MSLPAGRTLVQSLQILLIPCLHEVCNAFFKPFQGFPTSFGHISPYRCAKNFNFVKLKSFCLVELLRIYLQFFR